MVTSLANDVIMAPIAKALGFDRLEAWTVGGIVIGTFLGALLSFVVIATVLFLIVRAAARYERPAPEDVPAPDTDEVILLREIRDTLRAPRS